MDGGFLESWKKNIVFWHCCQRISGYNSLGALQNMQASGNFISPTVYDIKYSEGIMKK